MRTGIFVQFRLSSTRLPRKALLKLGNKLVVEHVLHRLKLVPGDVHALLTDEASYNELAPYAQSCGFEIFQGSADDVLDRFIKAAQHFKVDRIIRATGDNPLVSHIAASELLSRNITADYAGFQKMPIGAGVELLSVKALIQADSESSEAYDHEHVAPYLYNNPEKFVIKLFTPPLMWQYPKGRITLDTYNDYLYLQRLFNELTPSSNDDLERIIPWLHQNQIV